MSRIGSSVGVTVNDVVKVNSVLLEALAKRVHRNNEGVDNDTLIAWKNKVLELGTELVSVSNELEASQKALLSDEVRILIQNHNNENKTDIKDILRSVRARIETDMSKFDPSKAPFQVKLASIVKPKESSDDIEVFIDEQFTEKTYICPVTSKLMDIPMMIISGCIHRISKEGFEGMLQQQRGGQQFKCVIPGCPHVWKRDRCQVDEELQMEIQRSNRLKQTQSSSSSRAGGAIDVDAGDFGGYTQV